MTILHLIYFCVYVETALIKAQNTGVVRFPNFYQSKIEMVPSHRLNFPISFEADMMSLNIVQTDEKVSRKITENKRLRITIYKKTDNMTIILVVTSFKYLTTLLLA